MNFSPLNDPAFEEYRKKEAAKAARARRKKALIILVAVTLVTALATALLIFAAFDAVPSLFGGESPEATVPPAGETTETPAEPTDLPTESSPAPVVTPTLPSSPATVPTASAETPTVESPTQKVRTTTVYLDAGHGFYNAAGDALDKGAGNKDMIYYQLSEEMFGMPMYESDMVLIITKKIRTILEDAGYTVVMSREDYVYERVPIALRAAKAKEAGADLLVSIHANSVDDTTVSGARIYYNDNAAWVLSTESKHFAEDVAKSIDAYGASNRKTKVYGDGATGKTLAMLRGTGDIPSVLIETCFLTNEDDAKDALSEEWQDKMAKAVAAAIMARYELKTTFV